MRQLVKMINRTDVNGNPTGGFAKGVGINIGWQDGPLGNPPDLAKHNGAFVEGVIEAAIGRLKYFQSSKFHSDFNQDAIEHLEMALAALDARTEQRKRAGVEGMHAV